MSDLVLIDTSAWVEAFRTTGSPEIKNQVYLLIDEGKASWSEVIRLELWNGARGAGELQFLRDMEQDSILNIHLLPTTPEIWKLADQMARQARQKGMTFPVADLLIAACARHYRTGFLHKDRHFEKIAML